MKKLKLTSIFFLVAMMFLAGCQKDDDSAPPSPEEQARAQHQQMMDQQRQAWEHQRLISENFNDGGVCGTQVQQDYAEFQSYCSRVNVHQCAQVALQFLKRWHGINCHVMDRSNQFNETARLNRPNFAPHGQVAQQTVPNSAAQIHISHGRIQHIVEASKVLGGLLQ